MTNIPREPDLSKPQAERPIDVEGAPEEEEISDADVAERADLDPDEQVNLTEQDLASDEHPEDS